MPGTWTSADHLEILRKSLKDAVPYTCGMHPVSKEQLGLYFSTDGGDGARYIDFASLKDDAPLEALAAACDKATFGSDSGDVFDETYRKAGKLDTDKFSTRIDIVSSGLLDAVAQDLLVEFPKIFAAKVGGKVDEQAEPNPEVAHPLTPERVLRAEMYKLNVYGPGSFFKAHKDTPRGEDMVGSLVIILPTLHKGGALVLEHGEGRWTFDSSNRLDQHRESYPETPAVAYIAFFSDVVHIVEPVVSGFRVTLTYNLFLSPSTSSSSIHRITPAAELACETSLRALLSDPTWFKEGGHIAFGLSHQYPIPRDSGDRHVMLKPEVLKGADARLKNAALRAGLAPRLRLIYRVDEYEEIHEGWPQRLVVLDDVADMSYFDADEGFSSVEIEEQGEILKNLNGDGTDAVRPATPGDRYEYRRAPKALPIGVYWATPPTWMNQAKSSYTANYGNDYSEDCVYGDAALFIAIPPATDASRCIME
ncbi:C2H2-type domain-containing protein [Mycena indigotica]|uniref:C2H2-type domain-containing protein n=1 Tax=Mycena indigotica TaxID=2126181 RepID=A0A8H6VRJ5_9AGAR|nr:C2H2-type domain-containing protein [Mycena indigotica]KAF7291179.1 C2H2-type domain-containing protein [Mycena indigotica]